MANHSESNGNQPETEKNINEDGASSNQNVGESNIDHGDDRKISQISVLSETEVFMIDPSEHFRPEYKPECQFRIYTTNQEDYIQRRVFETYKNMHRNQTVKFVQDKMRSWGRFDKGKMGIMDALDKLNNLVDESDPDVDLPNIVHAFQTAERIREAHPDLEWFQLTGLIHDLGKLMVLYGEPQWAVVGDTYPVGCEFAESIVYRQESFEGNPDLDHPVYSQFYGMYKPNCGLKDVLMSWGHDEYMYQVLVNHHTCLLPEQALYMIRYHSFYPWHTGNEYYQLCSKHDLSMLPWIREFNRFDLYSKTPDVPDVKELIPYYQSLIDKFIPGTIAW